MKYEATPSYELGSLVETQRGAVARIAGVVAEFRAEGVTYRYHLQSSPTSKGFYLPEEEIARVLG